MKQAIIIYGPPGAGKGTQANLIARHFDLIHFDTGAYLEKVLFDPNNKDNKTIQKERKNFERGDLVTPQWILKIVKDRVKKLHQAGFGVVFSGSPRTEFEAFGDGRTEGLIKFLEKLYGKNNVKVLALRIPPEESLRRNRARLIAPLLGLPIMGTMHKLKISPFTGEPLVERKSLDKPEIIKERLIEYRERTQPIETGLKKIGVRVLVIDGTPLPFRVFESIKKKLK